MVAPWGSLNIFCYTLLMKKLLIFPTSRILRKISNEYKEIEGFLPTLMRMDEFEQRVILIPDRVMVDPLQRVLLLKEASNFKSFEKLKFNRELVRFFTKSDALFKFFEELAQESVDLLSLSEADAYAEFGEDLEVLELLFDRYKTILEERGFTDKAFIPQSYSLNLGFLDGYEQIEIHLEGYLSHYELQLIEKIAAIKPLNIHYVTSKFNQKMVERFNSYGIQLPQNSKVNFDFSNKIIVTSQTNNCSIDAQVLQVEERFEQISVAFAQIEKYIQKGVKAEHIVLVLPDESLKESIALYDRQHNLNFAMGFDYKQKSAYKKLEALYNYWQTYEPTDRFILKRYAIDLDKVDKITSREESDIESFFMMLNSLDILDCPLWNRDDLSNNKTPWSESVYEKQLHCMKIFRGEKFSYKSWLFLWMQSLSDITIDDVKGGKVTVMGLLETRGVFFDAVIIVDFNEGVVPATTSKDQFLNSSVRAFAGLPTQLDREALQKQYYKRLLEQSSYATILYHTSDNKLPSKFLYELGLTNSTTVSAQLSLLYSEPTQIVISDDPLVENFDASKIVWSASKLKVYLECKRKYYYKYIKNFKTPKDDERNEGSFMHLLLEHLYAEKDHYSDIDELKKTLDRLLSQLIQESDAKSEYERLLYKERLQGFLYAQLRHFEAGWRVVLREHEISGEIGGLRFKGIVDRIDQNSTDTLVIDYKSGSIKEANKSKNLESLTDFQMSIYDALLSSKFQNLRLVFMLIVEDGKIEEIVKLEEKNRILLEHINELKETKEFVANRCEELHRCKYCEYMLLCERGDYL